MDNNLQDQNNIQPEVQTPVQPVEPQMVAPVESMVQPPMEPQVQAPIVQPVEPQVEKKKKNILPIIIIIAILVIAGGGAAVYFMFLNKVSGKQVMDGTISQLFNKAQVVGTKMQEYVVIDYKNDIVHQTGDLLLNGEIKSSGGTVKYKDVRLNYDTKINLKDLEGSFKFGTSQEGKEIASIQAYLQNKVLYANSDLFETPYKVDLSELDWKAVEEYIKNMPDYKTNSLSTLINKSSKILQGAIKEEYITQTEGNYTIEGVSVEGLKNTLTIDGPRAMTIYKDVLNAIKADSEYVEILADFSGMTKEEVIKEIDDELASVDKSQPDKDSVVTISVYTTKAGKFLAMEVVGNTTSITAISENNVTTIRYKENNKEYYKYTYNEVEKEFTFVSEEGYELKVKFIDHGIKFTADMEGTIIDLSITNVNDGSSIKTTLESNLKDTTGEVGLSGNLKYVSELKKADKIDTFNVAVAKPFEEVTQEEQSAILAKLMEKAEGTYLMSLFKFYDSLTTIRTTPTDPYIEDI